MATKNQEIASETLYADADGNLVKAGDPKAAFKVVTKGRPITAAIAKRYNLDTAKAAPSKGADDDVPTHSAKKTSSAKKTTKSDDE